MWVFLNDSMVSIVAERDAKDKLRVRARVEGDIERLFPKASVFTPKKSDYAFHAVVSRKEVVRVLTESVKAIDYDNFKNSVGEDDRHDAYAEVWGAMYRFGDDRAWADSLVDREPEEEIP